jgi:hypothetical protein
MPAELHRIVKPNPTKTNKQTRREDFVAAGPQLMSKTSATIS